MTIYTYKMDHDHGTAPCVQDGVLTLALCKPEIRKKAKKGDYVIGIAGENLGKGRLIYAARITDTFGPGPAYYARRAHFNREDCVYEKAADGTAIHRPDKRSHNYAADPNFFRKRDVCIDWRNAYVLKSTDFRYLGRGGPGYCGKGRANYLFDYPGLRFLIEMSREDLMIEGGYHKIDRSSKDWSDIEAIIKSLWKNYPRNHSGKPTYRTSATGPRKWKTKYNNKVNAWRKLNPYQTPLYRFRLAWLLSIFLSPTIICDPRF